MRTTIRLDEQLLAEAKQIAARSGRTLTAVIEDAMRLAFSSTRRAKRDSSAKLPTYKGDGLLPGVDLDDSASLLAAMEEGD